MTTCLAPLVIVALTALLVAIVALIIAPGLAHHGGRRQRRRSR